MVPHKDDDDDVKDEDDDINDKVKRSNNDVRRRLNELSTQTTYEQMTTWTSARGTEPDVHVGNLRLAASIQKVTIGFHQDKEGATTRKSLSVLKIPFDGSDRYSIERWISDFEEMAALFGWHDIQKLVSGRKSLTGVVKMFVRGVSITQSLEALKAVLKKEFSLKVNSADIDRKLVKRKLKKG